jgi:hypothetical protein
MCANIRQIWKLLLHPTKQVGSSHSMRTIRKVISGGRLTKQAIRKNALYTYLSWGAHSNVVG